MEKELDPTLTAPAQPSLTEKIGRRFPHGARGIIGALLSLGLFTVALVIIGDTLSHTRFSDIAAALAETRPGQIAAALLFTILSYAALTGYDASALSRIRVRVRYRVIALASFASYAVSFNLGFPVITGAAVRYWVYARAPLSAAQVANVTIITGVTFWLGVAMTFGYSLVARATTLATLDHAPALLHVFLGVVVIAGVVAYCVWVALEPRQLRIRGHAFELPGPGAAILQICVGAADLCAAAAALYALLPPAIDLDFTAFVAVYIFACVLGVASHTPGGIGVFEATMLHALPGAPHERLLAALLLFRAIYYFLPFILALAALGADEGARRWPALRDAIARFVEERSR